MDIGLAEITLKRSWSSTFFFLSWARLIIVDGPWPFRGHYPIITTRYEKKPFFNRES